MIYTVAGENRIGGFTFPKAEVWISDACMLPSLFEEDMQAGRQGRLFMESAYVSLAKRYYALYAMTPMERYVDLIAEHPQIEQVVPQKEIAEYLQITPNSLIQYEIIMNC